MTFASLSDPVGADPLVGAAQWVESAMLGTVATAIAVIAVAAIGGLMLSGRIDWRRGARVIVGCFVLFGAATIAVGIRGGADGAETAGPAPPVPPPVIAVSPDHPRPQPAFDPYAGASVDIR